MSEPETTNRCACCNLRLTLQGIRGGVPQPRRVITLEDALNITRSIVNE